jgi:hypothetical protein
MARHAPKMALIANDHHVKLAPTTTRWGGDCPRLAWRASSSFCHAMSAGRNQLNRRRAGGADNESAAVLMQRPVVS